MKAIKIPDGWRKLKVGEVITDGDKFDCAGDWFLAHSTIGKTLGDGATVYCAP